MQENKMLIIRVYCELITPPSSQRMRCSTDKTDCYQLFQGLSLNKVAFCPWLALSGKT